MNKCDALEFLSRTAKGLAEMFGSSCETLVHDMSLPEHPILAIYNGHVSGRQVGSTVDILGEDDKKKLLAKREIGRKADTDRNLNRALISKDYVNLLVITPDGKKIKSSTLNFVGDGYHLALGINYDFTKIASIPSVLHDFINVGPQLKNVINQTGENILKDIVTECIAAIDKPVSEYVKADRLKLIAMLDGKNAFSFQKSVPYVAELLNVSRYTIYKYLHEITGQKSQ